MAYNCVTLCKAVGLLLLTASPLIAQEKPPAGPPEALVELQDFHFLRVRRRYFPLQIQQVTAGGMTFSFHSSETGREKESRIFPLGSRLPGSNYVIARLLPKSKKTNGIIKGISEVVLRHARNSREHTLLQSRYEEDTEATEDELAVVYAYTLVRKDGIVSRVDVGDEFTYPLSQATKYEVTSARKDCMVVKRLSDGQLFKTRLLFGGRPDLEPDDDE